MDSTKYLEVVNDSTEEMLLNNIGKISIGLLFLLDIGKINNMDDRKMFDFETKKNIDKFYRLLNQYKNIRIWFSSKESGENCFFSFCNVSIKRFL